MLSEPTDPRWLPAINRSGEEIPPHSLVRIGGSEEDGTYQLHKPDVDGQACWVSGPFAIGDGEVGVTTADWPAHAAYDAAETPAVGETWGAKSGSWKLTKDQKGFRIVGSPSPADELVQVEAAGGATAGSPTTTPAPTTTAAPCAAGYGEWSFGESGWSLAESTCEEPCFAAAPAWCPEASDLEGSCLTTRTRCGYYAADQTPLYCNPEGGTSGEPPRPPECTTTTTERPGCTEGCNWYCVPGRGWRLVGENGCTGDCSCTSPNIPCALCTTVHTDCVIPVRPSLCAGAIRWLCVVDVPGYENHWEYFSGSCQSTTDQQPCYADRPDDSTCNACAKEAIAPCYRHYLPGQSTASPGCPPYAPTTTASPPGSCSGMCLHRSDGVIGWDVVRSCLGCACQDPDREPESECDTEITPCIPTTTTTRPPLMCIQKTEVYLAVGEEGLPDGECGNIQATFRCLGTPGCDTAFGTAGGSFCAPDYRYLPGSEFGPYPCPPIGTYFTIPCHCPLGESSTTTAGPTTTTTEEPTTTTTTEAPACMGGCEFTATAGEWIETMNGCGFGGDCGCGNPNTVIGDPFAFDGQTHEVPCASLTTTTPAPVYCSSFSYDSGMYGTVLFFPSGGGAYYGYDDFSGLWSFVNDGAGTWTLTSPYTGVVGAIGWGGTGCQDFGGSLVCCQDA